jgi:hypothetical protein
VVMGYYGAHNLNFGLVFYQNVAELNELV